MPRAIFTEAHSPLWLEAAERLQREIALDPVYWVGKASFASEVMEAFPNAVFHARTDAIRGVPPPALADLPLLALDTDVLDAFGHPLMTACKMMDRLDVYDGFRFEERTRLAFRLLQYWRTVIDRFQPDVVVFPVQPHTVYDYLIYELCKARGIATSMLQWTLFHDWLYPLDDIATGYTEIRERYERLLAAGGDVTLPDEVERYFATVCGDYRQAIPDYLVREMPKELRAALLQSGDVVAVPAEGDQGLLAQAAVANPAEASTPPRFPSLRLSVSDPRRAWKYLRRWANDRAHRGRRVLERGRVRLLRTASGVTRVRWRRIRWSPRHAAAAVRRTCKRLKRYYRSHWRRPWMILTAGASNRPLKEPGRPIDRSFGGRFGGLRLNYWQSAGRQAKRELLREYLKRCGEIDRSVPFVFVALHYQPEQTTCPTGSVFVHQTLMVDMLARLVPSGWKVYVKEHPFQFFPTSIGERSRALDFYDDLIAHPNVTLVPWSVSPFDLIDHAQAIATVTGTTGIEAVIRGKPTLAFGYAWYRDCEGVFYTPDAASCTAALQQIAGGYRVDRSKVRRYAKAVEQACFRGDLKFGVKIEPIPHDENVARVAGAIRTIFERHQRTVRRAPIHHPAPAVSSPIGD